MGDLRRFLLTELFYCVVYCSQVERSVLQKAYMQFKSGYLVLKGSNCVIELFLTFP